MLWWRTSPNAAVFGRQEARQAVLDRALAEKPLGAVLVDDDEEEKQEEEEEEEKKKKKEEERKERKGALAIELCVSQLGPAHDSKAPEKLRLALSYARPELTPPYPPPLPSGPELKTSGPP